MSNANDSPLPSRATFMGAAIRLFSHPNPNARLKYHAITNKHIYFITQFWKDANDPIRASKEQEINYLIFLHYAESDLLASLYY